VIVLSENLGLRFRTELGEGTCDSLGNLQLYSLVTNQKFAEKIADIYRRKTIRASVVKFRTEAIRFDSRQELTAKMAPLDIMLCQVLGRGAVQSALLNQFGSMVYASSTELIPQVCSLQDLVDPMTGAVRKRMVEADSGLGLLVEFLRGPGVYII
jgi:hypothetical protein